MSARQDWLRAFRVARLLVSEGAFGAYASSVTQAGRYGLRAFGYMRFALQAAGAVRRMPHLRTDDRLWWDNVAARLWCTRRFAERPL